ncbi:MAG TPA: hypothetical protein VF841_14460 [Anaeromyxobacter sp.]
MSPLDPRAALGRPLSLAAVAAVAVGIVAFGAGLATGHAAAAFAALDASWLFFAGLAAGSVALVAAIRIAHGRWAASVLPLAEAGVGFFVPAFVLLLLLRAGLGLLLPEGVPLGPGDWVRVVGSSAILFFLGLRFIGRSRLASPSGEGVRGPALAYVVVYAITLSLWAYELVMKVAGGPPATVIPAFYFFGALLSALAWVALLAAVKDVSGPDLRHDLGKLLFAFIVVWTYLLWALFLPTWYGNIPDESAFLLRRWHGGFRPLTIAVLVAVFFWPFWLLFSEQLKRRRGTLAFGAATVLAGLAAERFLLVIPSVRVEGDAGAWLVGAGVAAGVAGVFLLAVGGRLGRAPPAPEAAAPGPR